MGLKLEATSSVRHANIAESSGRQESVAQFPFHPLLLQTASTFSLAHDGNPNVPGQWYRGYLSQSIVSCLRLSVTLAIPYVSLQAQCKTARVKVRARSRCREMIEATLQSRCRICGFQRLANLPVSHGTQLS
jgi:hypothetical protein